MTRPPEDRWRGRPVIAACLRALVSVLPLVALGVAVGVSARLLHHGSGSKGAIVRWSIALACGAAAGVGSDRLARRLLPLVVLLRLDLAFPETAPSRVAVARAATRLDQLEERLAIARTAGFDSSPGRAAEMILSLVAAVEAHDRATRGHAERVRIYTDRLAVQLKLYPQDRDKLRWAALLHDVGKLEVPRSVLNKPGPLSAGELEVVRRHPEESARLTAPLHPWLGEWANAIVEHHERYDGLGYPGGLAGSGISLAARIVAVTDCYETMTASRPYHRPKTPAQARTELLRCSGTQFDPAIVNAFLQIPQRELSVESGPAALLARMPLLRRVEPIGSRS